MKQATFFCDNCAKPVPLDAAECPHCGSRFTAVQCPQCSFVGKAELFSEGCPECGYLSPTTGSGPLTFARNSAAGAPRSTPQNAELKPLPAYRKSESHMPGWFYTLTSILLLAVLVVLMIIILRLT
jgi:DNA-directed RNA polymerase subunit RPC12/RpoP